MPAFRGAQTEHLRDLSSSAARAAGRITELLDALDGMASVEENWQSSNADSFRTAYTPHADLPEHRYEVENQVRPPGPIQPG